MAQESKLAKRAEEEQQSGKKKPGRKPVSPDAVVDHDRKGNTTDPAPASRIMKTSQGHVQGFNAQAMVTTGQCIVSAEITQDENNVHQLEPMLAALEATLEAAGIEDRSQTLAADAGYWHDQLEVTVLEQEGPESFIATASRLKEAQAHQAEVSPRAESLTTSPRSNAWRASCGPWLVGPSTDCAARRWSRSLGRSRAPWAAEASSAVAWRRCGQNCR